MKTALKYALVPAAVLAVVLLASCDSQRDENVDTASDNTSTPATVGTEAATASQGTSVDPYTSASAPVDATVPADPNAATNPMTENGDAPMSNDTDRAPTQGSGEAGDGTQDGDTSGERQDGTSGDSPTP